MLMDYNKFVPESGVRLYDLLIRFQQGDHSSFENIIERFNWMIIKASYNGVIGGLDDDLRSEILITLFLNLKKFVIPDRNTLMSILGDRAGDSFELQPAQV